jgi:O-antigen/teichoic acid export membrane protein
MAITVTLLSDFIIELFYGVQYADAAPVLTVHVWTAVFVFFGIASGQYLVLENQMKLSFYRTLFGLVTNVVLNFVLIPILGTVGAAWATLISQAFSALISNLFFRPTRNLFFMYLKSANLLRFVNR